MVKSVYFDTVCYNDLIIWRNSGMFSSLPILNRRTFLKGVGLAGAAGLLSACGGASTEGYTTAQYEQFARDFAAAASAN